MNAGSVDRFPATVFVTESLTLKTQSCTHSVPALPVPGGELLRHPYPYYYQCVVVVRLYTIGSQRETNIKLRFRHECISRQTQCLLDMLPTTRIRASFCGGLLMHPYPYYKCVVVMFLYPGGVQGASPTEESRYLDSYVGLAPFNSLRQIFPKYVGCFNNQCGFQNRFWYQCE